MAVAVVPTHHFPAGMQQKSSPLTGRAFQGGKGKSKYETEYVLKPRKARKERHYKKDDFCLAWLLCQGQEGWKQGCMVGAVAHLGTAVPVGFLQLLKPVYVRPSSNNVAQVNRSEGTHCSLSAPSGSGQGKEGCPLASASPLHSSGKQEVSQSGVAAKSRR